MPEFVAECAKIDLEINFVGGEDVEALVNKLYVLPEERRQRSPQDRRGEVTESNGESAVDDRSHPL